MEHNTEQLIDIAQEGLAPSSLPKRIWDNVSFFVVPFLILFVLLGVVFSIAWVPSGSMEPTLPTKSYFIGWRLPYFFADPMPERGDIVMFRSEELDELLVKRTVGLPGDTVSIENGAVCINGNPLYEPYLHDGVETYPMSEETVFIVPEGHIFVLGDNRPGSFDSRAWNDPYVPVSKIRSKAIVGFAFLPECTWRGVRLYA